MSEYKEIGARLDLIQLTNNLLRHAGEHRHELSGLIEALCRHRDMPIDTCLSSPRIAALDALAPSEFGAWMEGRKQG